jgi:hypothetical protein
MSVSIKSPIAFAFTVAISLFALPALGAPAHDTGHKPAQNRIADFANASAFVSPETGLSQALETDGLGRKDEECNMGCVDH